MGFISTFPQPGGFFSASLPHDPTHLLRWAAVAARIGVTVPELAQHRAVDDAELTARVLIEMAELRGATCAASALGGFTASAVAFVK